MVVFGQRSFVRPLIKASCQRNFFAHSIQNCALIWRPPFAARGQRSQAAIGLAKEALASRLVRDIWLVDIRAVVARVSGSCAHVLSRMMPNAGLARIQSNYHLSKKEVAAIRQRAAEIDDIITSDCRAGKYRFDLTPTNILTSGNELTEVSCD